MATKSIHLTITSADPENTTYRGIYSDLSYDGVYQLTSDKSYDFQLSNGEIKNLFIGYQYKPAYIECYGNPRTDYSVFITQLGTTEVLHTNSSTGISVPIPMNSGVNWREITITEIKPSATGYERIITKINDEVATLPYTTRLVSGQPLYIEVELIYPTTTTSSTTTTTTPNPAVLGLQTNQANTTVDISGEGLSTKTVNLTLTNTLTPIQVF